MLLKKKNTKLGIVSLDASVTTLTPPKHPHRCTKAPDFGEHLLSRRKKKKKHFGLTFLHP